MKHLPLRTISIALAVALLTACSGRPPSLTNHQQYEMDGQLLRAAYLGQTQRVAELINQGADVDAFIGDRWDAWTKEDFWGLDGGVPMNGSSLTVFLATLQSYVISPEAQAEIAKLLIKAGADIDTSDSYGATPLYMAIEAGQNDLALELIKRGAKLNTETEVYIDGEQGSPLWLAVKREEPVIVKALLDAGADPSEPDNFGWGPLPVAIKSDEPELVDLLLAAGASLDYSALLTEKVGGQAADIEHVLVNFRHFPIEDVHPQMVRSLISAGVEPKAVSQVDAAHYFANALPSPTLVSDLLDAGLSPTQVGSSGWTGLHFAAGTVAYDGDRCIRWMLEKVQGSPDLLNDHEETPLMVAVNYGNTYGVHRLCDAGADPDQRDVKPGSPLQNASSAHDVPSLLVLLHAGADPALAPELIFDAINHEDPMLVRTLIRFGVDLSEELDGWTPLAYAHKQHRRPQWDSDVKKLAQIVALLEAAVAEPAAP